MLVLQNGLDWRARAQRRLPLAGVCGIANGWLRYLPHKADLAHARADEHYEVLMSTLGPGACERLLATGEDLVGSSWFERFVPDMAGALSGHITLRDGDELSFDVRSPELVRLRKSFGAVRLVADRIELGETVRFPSVRNITPLRK